MPTTAAHDRESHAELHAIAPTFFTDNGLEVDEAAMASNVEKLSAEGVDKYLLAGSYGEFQSLTVEERFKILAAVRSIEPLSSVMVCAALPSTQATANLALELLDEGADLVMVAPPLLTEVRDADVMRHFEILSRIVGGNLVVYNTPLFGMDLTAHMLGEIADMDGYVAVKQGTTDMANFADSLSMIRAKARPLRMLVASDMVMVPSLLAEVDGLTSTNVWAFPTAIKSVLAAARRSDPSRVREFDAAIEPYRRFVRTNGQPMTIKAAMNQRGFAGTDRVRLPLTELPDGAREELRRVMHQCDENIARIDAQLD